MPVPTTGVGIFVDQVSHVAAGTTVSRKLMNVEINNNRMLDGNPPRYLMLNQDTAGDLAPISYTSNFSLAGTTAAKVDPGSVTALKRWENAEDPRPYAIGSMTNATPAMRLIRTGGVDDAPGFVSANSVDAGHDPEVRFRWRSGWDCGAGFNAAPTTGQLPETRYILRVNGAGFLFLFIDGGFYGQIGGAVSSGDLLTARYVRATGKFEVEVNDAAIPPVALGGGALSGALYLDAPIFTGAIDLLYFGTAGSSGTAYPAIGGMIYQTDTLATVRSGGIGAWAGGSLSANTVAANQDAEVVLRWLGGDAVGVGFTNSSTSTGRLADTDYVLHVDASGSLYFFIGGSFYTSFPGYTVPSGGRVMMRYVRSEARLHMYIGDVEVTGLDAPIYLGPGALAGPVYLGCPVDTGSAAIEYFGPRRT